MSDKVSEWIVCRNCGVRALAINEGEISTSYDRGAVTPPHKIERRDP